MSRYPVEYLAPYERCRCTLVPGVHGIGHPHITEPPSSPVVVIGTSPFADTSVVVGPFAGEQEAADAWSDLTARGYVAETCTLVSLDEVPLVENDEGADQ